jgi:enamine deaminase RidA (YjgF/YER057c/UK114 family)
MGERKKVSTGTKWEAMAGYSRAIQVGNSIHVAGTTATDDDGNIVGVNDAYTQSVFIIQKIEKALKELGASLEDVVRTRIYVVNKDDWQAAAKAHGEFFGDIRPANTLVVIAGLVGDDYLVEIEADALVGDAS